MTPYFFHTPTTIPIEAFNTFGFHAKPNSDNPIGHFGTGLKLALAVILRNGGKVKVTIDGVEHEFYTKTQEIRGKDFEQVRMRKRHGIATNWRSVAMPFTTELGKEWHLWQAFRELESNTRDENGRSGVSEKYATNPGTVIQVDCEGFAEVHEDENSIFLDKPGPLLADRYDMEVFDAPSKYLYYRGVRVYEMRYPAKLTYNFKKSFVTLSEDRGAANSFMLFYRVAIALQEGDFSKGVLNRVLKIEKDAPQFFEGHDLTFGVENREVTENFRSIARALHLKGFAAPSASSYHNNSMAYRAKASETSVQMTDVEWGKIISVLRRHEENTLAEKIETQL